MANVDPVPKDVFPAELTEIYRRRQKVLPKQPIQNIQPLVKALDEAEKKLDEAEKRVRELRETHYIRSRFWKTPAIQKAEGLVEERREDLKKKQKELNDYAPPSVDLGLVGLAFSGGGIRSATFNLGILQGLADLGILRFFDYLSTVSGGGYIGSWLSAWIWHERTGAEGGFATVEAQLRPALSARERQAKNAPATTVGEYPPQCGPDPIFHLRRYSNYLTPRVGIFSQDTWTGIATYVRNLLLIQLMLIPTLAIGLLIPRVLAEGFNVAERFKFIPVHLWLWSALLAFLLLAGVALISTSSALNRLWQRTENHFELRHLLWWICGPAVLAAFIFSRLFGMQRAILGELRPLTPLLQSLLIDDSVAWFYWILSFAALTVATCLIRAVYAGKYSRVARRVLGAFFIGAVLGGLFDLLLHFGILAWLLGILLSGSSVAWIYWILLFAVAHLTIYLLCGVRQPWFVGGIFIAVLSGGAVGLLLYWDLATGLLKILLAENSLTYLWWALTIGILNVAVYFICAFYHSGAQTLHNAQDVGPQPHGGRVVFWWRIFSDFVSGFVGGVLLYALLHFGLWRWGTPDIVSFGPPLFLIVFLLATTVQVGLRAITETDAAREWRASMAAWLLIYASVWAVLCAIAFYGPLGWALLLAWTKTKTALILTWLGSTLATVLAGKSPKTGNSGNSSKLEWVLKVGPVIAVVGLLIAIASVSHQIVTQWSGIPPTQTNSQGKASSPQPLDAQKKAVQATLGGTVQLDSEQLKVDVNVKSEEGRDRKRIKEDYWTAVSEAKPGMLFVLIILCGSVAGILAYRVDVNEFSLHAAYRNRLVRCYLGASRGKQRSYDPITGFDPHDDLPLASLLPGPDYEQSNCYYDGPYLIINTALNQMAGKELAWQQRKATSFVLTPRFCGSGETGYKETEDFCGCIDLGTAFAISGAAVSPNMGYHSSGPIAFLLTLFNVRLGWWVRNPKKNGQSRGSMRPVRFPYLLSELFGQTTEDSQYVYLSDGGHFENLGIYELVRRRCKYIVCCDAGADPLIAFEDLGNAIRKIRTDLGVSIEIDLDMIRPEAGQRHSRWHQAIGVIRYDQVDADESVGMLVYIKASLTGDESGDVLEYASQHVSFPYDPTADQFFTESQFESYRKLGEHVAWEVFRYAQAEVEEGGAASVFNNLRHHWVSLPPRLRDSFLGQQEALVKLEAKLRDDPGLANYDAQIYPEIETLLGANQASGSDPRAALHFCNMQLDLMENVFVALELEKYNGYALNRGWMNLFRRLAMTPIFQKLWPGLRGGYSRQFADFVEEFFIPAAPFRIIDRIPTRLVQRLVDEFKRDQLSETIAPEVPDLLATSDVLAWSAVPNDNASITEAWGVALVLQNPAGCQLFVWVRGAYRNLGIGGKLLDQALSKLKTKGFKEISVHLGEDKPGNPSYQQRKAKWLRLYGQRGFVREVLESPPGQPSPLRLKLTLS